jgi:hypothetical protein
MLHLGFDFSFYFDLSLYSFWQLLLPLHLTVLLLKEALCPLVNKCQDTFHLLAVSRALERLPEMTYLLLQATEDRHAARTLSRINQVFYWPDMCRQVGDFVRACIPCQRAKAAQDTRVGLHSSQVVTRPMERVFIDFVGPLVRSRKGNVAPS